MLNWLHCHFPLDTAMGYKLRGTLENVCKVGEMMCVFWSRVWLVFKGLSWVEDDLSYAVVRPWLMDKIKWMATLAKVRALREPTGHSCRCDQGSRGVAMGIRGTAHG